MFLGNLLLVTKSCVDKQYVFVLLLIAFFSTRLMQANLKTYTFLRSKRANIYVAKKGADFFERKSANDYIIGGLGWWIGFLKPPYERDYYLGVSLESQTTNPNH